MESETLQHTGSTPTLFLFHQALNKETDKMTLMYQLQLEKLTVSLGSLGMFGYIKVPIQMGGEKETAKTCVSGKIEPAPSKQ